MRRDRSGRRHATARSSSTRCCSCSRCYYLLPLYVMLVDLVQDAGRDPQRQHAGAAARTRRSSLGEGLGHGLRRRHCDGIKRFFWNSIKMVVPAVADLDAARRAQRLRADQVALPRRRRCSSALMLFGCFIPFQIVLHADGAHCSACSGSPTRSRAWCSSTCVYGLCFTTLFFRNYYVGVPDELIKAAQHRRRRLLPHLRRDPAAALAADPRRHGDLAVHQHLERLPVRRHRSPAAVSSRSPWRSNNTRRTRRPASRNTTSTWPRR